MPRYSYQCPRCHVVFERDLHFDEDLSKVTCPNGHLQVERVYKPPKVVFKGHGYYVTDNHTARHPETK